MVLMTWFTILVGIFVIGIMWAILGYILYSPTVGLYYMVNASTINNTGAQSALSGISLAFTYFPLVLIVGLIIWGIVSAQRREPDTSYYG